MLHKRAKTKGHEKDCRHYNTKEWQPLCESKDDTTIHLGAIQSQ